MNGPILAPKNTKVNGINQDILNSLQEETIEYKLIDTKYNPDKAIHYGISKLFRNTKNTFIDFKKSEKQCNCS